MKYIKFLIVLFILIFSLSGCMKKTAYEKISPEQVKKLTGSKENFLLVDVRTQQEYNEGHIPGSILFPVDKIQENFEEKYPDKNTLIIVYCRSGNRSRNASITLIDMGYTNVKDMGGIQSWPYETTK